MTEDLRMNDEMDALLVIKRLQAFLKGKSKDELYETDLANSIVEEIGKIKKAEINYQRSLIRDETLKMLIDYKNKLDSDFIEIDTEYKVVRKIIDMVEKLEVKE